MVTKTHTTRPRQTHATKPSVKASGPSAETLAAAASYIQPSSSAPLTRITPMIGAGAIFPMAHSMIAEARHSIQLEMYEFENPATAGTPALAGVAGAAEQQLLMWDLVDAAKRGVKVQVILDQGAQRGGALHNSPMVTYLQAHGVEVLAYPPQSVNMDHVKLLITDGNKALIGGMNWSDHSPINHDADILVEGLGASNLLATVFEPDWQFSGGQLSAAPTARVADPVMEVLTTSPAAVEGGSNSILKGVVRQIETCKKHAYIEMYTLTHQDVIDALIAAHQRKVDVKVLLDPSQHFVNQKTFDQLKAAGVDVKWYNADPTVRQLLHAKWGTFDDESLIVGSANWSVNGLGTAEGQSSGHNHEASVLVHETDVSSAFHTQFKDDWENHATDTVPVGFATSESDEAPVHRTYTPHKRPKPARY